ncbi:MAG TPA: PIG-L deacetylase family protein [Actinomycetes bacterium]|nr:PIG-L deacetylase family protein [Actinomycetes bacterium]
MLGLALGREPDAPLRVLALGAHPDDIEIGCGGTLLRLVEEHSNLTVDWVVLSGAGERAGEAAESGAAFLEGAGAARVAVERFRDGFFPYIGVGVKEFFKGLESQIAPDLIFTHRLEDRHQDHRLVAELTWNTFRNHLILEYEIPKYEGDLGQPNLFVPLAREHCERKIQLLLKHFPSQAGRAWFTEDTFWAVLRLRGVESNAPSRFAEAFHARKVVSNL